jgi:hypothetical protein
MKNDKVCCNMGYGKWSFLCGCAKCEEEFNKSMEKLITKYPNGISK